MADPSTVFDCPFSDIGMCFRYWGVPEVFGKPGQTAWFYPKDLYFELNRVLSTHKVIESADLFLSRVCHVSSCTCGFRGDSRCVPGKSYHTCTPSSSPSLIPSPNLAVIYEEDRILPRPPPPFGHLGQKVY